ncbi:sensor histidine kinase [Romboutsia weinsteinii]|uniref:histidine kinase n=1 Tax=Romboutsia weinsteinii TaxID=2020949 RepID=A0A371J8B4_9FIRM|nr:HAMP domain-containing sensor histidine kinase [Romboutsia weinsteinii]RDY29021.1 sensor histidine kinase [Romboutsia weinsteinii]
MTNKNVLTKTKNSLIKINILVVGSFLVIFSLFIYSYFQGLTNQGIDSKLEEEFEYITTQLSSNSFFNPMTLKDPRDMVYVYENGRVRYYTENRYFDGVLPNKREDKNNEYFTYTENGYTFRELKVKVGKYTMQIIRNIDSEVSSLKQLMFVLVIGIFASVIITYYVAVYLTKKALVPIETAWVNQEKFIQDASHELRTPIAIVSSKLESLLKHPNNIVSDEVETIADAMKETRRLKKMISDLLSLTKEDSITKTNLEKLDIKQLIDEISNDYADIAEFQNKSFNISYELRNKYIITDKNKLRQMLLIFIDNSFKYTKKGDSISIDIIEEKENSIDIYIKDTGIGIKEKELSSIFDRFFRSENVRNQDIDGSGIGLSIAKMIILNLKGKVEVNSILGKGTEFKISIPNLSNKNI